MCTRLRGTSICKTSIFVGTNVTRSNFQCHIRQGIYDLGI